MRRRDVAELLALAVVCMVAVGPGSVLPGAPALGRPTRDLYDHLALLDAWFTHTGDWSYPEGGSLMPPDLFGMVIAAPALAHGMGRVAAYNLSLIVRLWLACVAGWLLGRRSGSGLVAGVAFGLSPFLYGEVYTGEAETLSAWPLALMAALLESSSAWAWAGAGVVAAVGAVGSWYYGVFLSFYIAIWTIVRLRAGDRRAIYAGLVFVALVAAPAMFYSQILAAPDQLFRGPDMADYLQNQPRALAGMVSDPAGWFGGMRPGATHEDRLGLVIVGMALLGLLDRDWKGRGWWAAVVFGGLALAIGPVLYVGGSEVTSYTPYHLLAQLPLFGLMRLPHRWLLVVSLGLAVLAARGAREVPLVAAGLIVAETLLFGVPCTTAIAPAPVTDLAGPVLDLPPRTLGADDARGHYLLWQRTHLRPVPYSLSMSAWSATLATEPLMIDMAALDSEDRLAQSPVEAEQFRQRAFALAVAAEKANPLVAKPVSGARDRLTELGFTDVLLHLDLLAEGDRESALAVGIRALGEPDQKTDEWVRWKL